MSTRFWSQTYLDDTTASIVSPGFESTPQTQWSPWDIVYIANNPLPGVCQVKADVMRKLDKKKAPGTDGAQPTFHGYDPARITITCMVWTPEQIDELDQQISTLWTPAGKKDPQAFNIYHPKLDQLGIRSIIIIGISALDPGPVLGSHMMTFHCMEFLPPKKKKATVNPKKAVDVKPSTLESPPTTPGKDGANTKP